MRIFLLWTILACSLSGGAQVTFRKYFSCSGNNLPRNGCYIPGGGYIICSSGNSFIRIDTSGNIIWSVTVQSPVYIESVAVSSDTCFVFSGYTFNVGPAPMNEIAAGKLDGNGNLLWLSVIDSTNKTIKTVPVPTSDGGVIVSTTENTNLFSGDFMLGLARFSSTGQLLWHKIVEGNSSTNYMMDVDRSGNAYVASARVDTTAWLFGFDDQGVVTWSRKNNSLPSFIYSPVDVERISTGYVTTHKLNNLFFFDTLGNAITERKYSVVGGTLTLENLLGTNDGGLLVGGRVITSAGDSMMLILKTDGIGTVLWATTYDTTVRYIRNMEESPDGYFITREMSATTTFMLLKTDLLGRAFCGESVITISMTPVAGLISPVQGSLVTNSWAQSYYQPSPTVIAKSYTGWECSGVGIPESEVNAEMRLYPNPSSGIFYFDESLTTEAEVTLYTVTGQLIWCRPLNDGYIDLTDRREGTYILMINDGPISRIQRLVITR
jgi:hypothetical protein